MQYDKPFAPDYRAIVEAQSELISLAWADGTLVYVNAAYGRHFGRTSSQMVGTNLYDLVPTEERDAVRNLISAVLQDGEVKRGENRIGTTAGERWMAWTNSRQVGAAGEPLLHSVGRDITGRKVAERALQDSQALLERTGRVAGVGGWMVDIPTSKVIWSNQTRRIHEVDDDFEPTLETAIQFYAPEARAAIETAVQTAVREAKPWDLELPFITAKGRHIWVRAVGEVEFEHGHPVRLVGAFQDITERHDLQQRVAADERFLRQVTDNLPVRIAYVDAERRFQFVNQAHCERFGRPREQIIGRTRSELTGGANDAVVAPHVDAVLAGRAQRFEYEEMVEGTTRRIESQLLPDHDTDGRVRGFFAIGVDITARHAGERAMRELTEILEASPDLIVQTDWRGNISYLNPAGRRAAGIPANEELPSGLNFRQFNTPETNLRFADAILPTVKATGAWIGESTLVAEGGRPLPVSHLVIGHRDDQGRVARYSGVMRDISDQLQAQRDLDRQRATLHSVAQSIPAAVAVVSPDQRYRFVNSAFERWVGLPKEQVLGRTVRDVIGAGDHARSQPWIDRVLAGETVHFERDYHLKGQARHYAVSYVPLWGPDGKTDGFVGVVQDISDVRHEHKRLMQLSQIDTLTGLLNRAGFQQALDDQINAGAGSSLALLYIDLDRFKPINDTHGHPIGDAVLKGFGRRLRDQVRPTDVVARLGGDEFVVLLLGVREAANADAVGAKVAACAAAPFEVGTLRLSVGASVGVAFGVPKGSDGAELLARADSMLYRAKKAGRGKHASDWDGAI